MRNEHKIVLIIVVIPLIVFMGVYFYKRNKGKEVPTNTAENYLATEGTPLKKELPTSIDRTGTFTNEELANFAQNYIKTKDVPVKNTSLTTEDGIDTFTNNDYGFSISFPHSLPASYHTSSKVVTNAKTNSYTSNGTSTSLNRDPIDKTQKNLSILVQDESAFETAQHWEYNPISTTTHSFANGLTGTLIVQKEYCDGVTPCDTHLIFAADPITTQKVPYQLVFDLSYVSKDQIASQKELFLKIIGSFQFIK